MKLSKQENYIRYNLKTDLPKCEKYYMMFIIK